MNPASAPRLGVRVAGFGDTGTRRRGRVAIDSGPRRVTQPESRGDGQADGESLADDLPEDETDDPVEEWERYPARVAEENVGYQKLAWYAAPFGDAGVAVVLLAATVNGLRRVGRALIRLLVR